MSERSRSLLHIVGSCEGRLFGLSPAERLRRQRGEGEGPLLVAHASAVLSDATVAWLLDNPETVITSPSGRALAVAVDRSRAAVGEQALEGSGDSLRRADPTQMPPQFIRKLRRRDTLLARSLAEEPVVRVERALFDTVYKGVTDIVTKYAWPLPAFWVTRLTSRIGVSPNMVTSLGLLLTFAAAYLFYRADLVAGLAAAWAMTFLDTVDGKLARVTVTSSAFGNLLDHVTDYIHPPIWWFCLAAGLAALEPLEASRIWLACWVILGTYVVGRGIEEWFKWRIGFNQYLWRPFDSVFRLIVSRRNVILLIMSAGLLLGAGSEAFVLCAVWSIVSVAIQGVRLAQALSAASAEGPLRSWLM